MTVILVIFILLRIDLGASNQKMLKNPIQIPTLLKECSTLTQLSN